MMDSFEQPSFPIRVALGQQKAPALSKRLRIGPQRIVAEDQMNFGRGGRHTWEYKDDRKTGDKSLESECSEEVFHFETTVG